MKTEEIDLYTIGETAKIIDVDQHVIRFWTDKFSKYIQPQRKAGLRRYYSEQDIELLKQIKTFLYDKAISIKGVMMLLDEHGSLSDIHTSSTAENSIKNCDNVEKEIINRLDIIRSKISNKLNDLKV